MTKNGPVAQTLDTIVRASLASMGDEDCKREILGEELRAASTFQAVKDALLKYLGV